MKFILIIWGILMVLSGFGVLFNPEIVTDVFTDNKVNLSFYIGVIVVRLIFGFLLVWTAELSKFPRVIKFFGYLAIIAALIFVLIGLDGFQDFISEIIPQFGTNNQIAGLLSISFGGFLIYAYSEKNKTANPS